MSMHRKLGALAAVAAALALGVGAARALVDLVARAAAHARGRLGAVRRARQAVVAVNDGDTFQHSRVGPTGRVARPAGPPRTAR